MRTKTHPLKSERNQELIERARKIIYANLSDPDFSLEDLAQKLYISTRQIQRIFLKTGSRGFRYELHLARMRAGKHYLRSGNDSVASIAHKVGFKGPMHFSKAFRRQTGMSPIEWRRACNNISQSVS